MKLSIRAKFIIMSCLLVTLALLLMAGAMHLPLRRALMDQQAAFLNRSGGVRAAHLDVALSYIDTVLQSVASDEGLRTALTQNDKDGGLSRLLRSQQSATRHLISKLLVVDAAGQVVAASERAAVGRRLADFWHNGQVNNRFVLGSHTSLGALPLAEHPALAQALAVELPNGTQCAVVAYLDWTALTADYLSMQAHDDDDALLVLTNSQGGVLGVSKQLGPERLLLAEHPVDSLQGLDMITEGPLPAPGNSFQLTYHGRPYLAVGAPLHGELGWNLVSAHVADTDSFFLSTRLAMLLSALAALLLAAIVASRMGTRMRHHLLNLVPAFDALSSGDLDCQVQVGSGDEIEQIGLQFNAVVLRLRDVFVNIVDSTAALTSSATLLADLGQTLVNSAQETSSQADAASKISDEVSTNINTVSAGVEEMSLSINEIARSSDEAARVATSAVRIADMTNTTVTELGGSSSEIGNVIKVINSIAEQTNLLALNATIEAARAGEAGKGFAVVANEVKELAKETARATEDIGKKIEAIQAKTKGAVAAIGEIGSIINKVNDYQTTIASAVQEQLATTTEIGRNVAEVAERSYMITKNISAVAQIADSSSTGANDSSTAIGEIGRIAGELHSLVKKFHYTRS